MNDDPVLLKVRFSHNTLVLPLRDPLYQGYLMSEGLNETHKGLVTKRSEHSLLVAWLGKVHWTLWALIALWVKCSLYTWYTIMVVIASSGLCNWKAQCLQDSKHSINWQFYCYSYHYRYGEKMLVLQNLIHTEWPRVFLLLLLLFCVERTKLT